MRKWATVLYAARRRRLFLKGRLGAPRLRGNALVTALALKVAIHAASFLSIKKDWRTKGSLPCPSTKYLL